MLQIPDSMIPVLKRMIKLIADQGDYSADPIKRERLIMGFTSEIMEHFVGGRIRQRDRDFGLFKAVELTPFRGAIPGNILYLHGGGYCTGGMEYAAWFGKFIAAATGARTLCPAYRLAPESPFPAALEDALATYRFLLENNPDEKIALMGESAGGGLCYALCLKLKEENLPQPEGVVALSPWTDLTLSGESYQYNRERDPSLSYEKLVVFSKSYTDRPEQPLCSPLFGDLKGLPESLIYVGGSEILLDDSRRMRDALEKAGCRVRLTEAEDMWHVYLFYNLRRYRDHILEISEFLRNSLR